MIENQWSLLSREHWRDQRPKNVQASLSTHNTRGDLIFSANRVRLALFQAYFGVSEDTHGESVSVVTGVTEVNMQG